MQTHILIISLVDPASHPGGAGTYTRGLMAALRQRNNGGRVDLVGPLHAPPGPWCRLRRVVCMAHSCMSRHPAKVLFARRNEFRTRIRKAVHSGPYDVVLVNGSDMLWALDDLPTSMPIVLIAHNLEHQLLAQQFLRYPVLSSLFMREVAKQRQYEIEGFQRAYAVMFLSATEMAWGLAQAPGLRALHVPPMFALPPTTRQPRPNGLLRLGYLADCAWWPNRQNWAWLHQRVLSFVRRPIQVHAFGRQSELLPAYDRAVLHGRVSDLATVWDQVDIMVCPIHAGAGVSVKVAESLYHGMPVLTTTQAARGLAISSGQGLKVIDHAEEWAAFLDSPEADRLAAQSPSADLRKRFAVDRHRERLKRFILDTVRDSRPALAADGQVFRKEIPARGTNEVEAGTDARSLVWKDH